MLGVRARESWLDCNILLHSFVRLTRFSRSMSIHVQVFEQKTKWNEMKWMRFGFLGLFNPKWKKNTHTRCILSLLRIRMANIYLECGPDCSMRKIVYSMHFKHQLNLCRLACYISISLHHYHWNAQWQRTKEIHSNEKLKKKQYLS